MSPSGRDRLLRLSILFLGLGSCRKGSDLGRSLQRGFGDFRGTRGLSSGDTCQDPASWKHASKGNLCSRGYENECFARASRRSVGSPVLALQVFVVSLGHSAKGVPLVPGKGPSAAFRRTCTPFTETRERFIAPRFACHPSRHLDPSGEEPVFSDCYGRGKNIFTNFRPFSINLNPLCRVAFRWREQPSARVGWPDLQS